MPILTKLFLGYLGIVNLIAVAVTVADKSKARRHRWRIPEATLFLIAALGGSPAMFLTMLAIRHKTQKKRFLLGIPTILLLQIAAGVFLWRALG